MGIWDDVRDLLDPAAVTVRALSGRDMTAFPIYSGLAVTYVPHFHLVKSARVRLANGDVVQAAGQVYVAGFPSIPDPRVVDVTSQLQLKDGSKRRIVAVDAYPDEPEFGVGVQVVSYQ